MPIFWKVLIINECLILPKVFYVSIEIIIWFLYFNLLIWYITLIDLCILKNPCISGINPTWSRCMNFLMYCWILFAKICWGYLQPCWSVILACSFLFICFSVYMFSFFNVSLGLKWVSCRQHVYGSCFCMHSATLCFLFGAFNPFTFKVIIDIYVPIAIF